MKIEFQAHNDRFIHARMMEYAGLMYRHKRAFPEQIVIYFGRARMRMRDLWKYRSTRDHAMQLLEQGREEGREEGRQEATAEIVLSLLERRFSKVPASTVARLRAASMDQLKAVADAVLTAPNVRAALDPLGPASARSRRASR